MSYIGNSPVVQATRTVTEIVATAGQTVFNANGGYTVGFLDVFLNGAQLKSNDFTATNGTSVALVSAATLGDEITLVAWGTFSVASLSPAAVSDQPNTSTGAFNPPKGTTAQRPGTPELGATRWNSTTNKLEVYTGGTSLWVNVASQSTTYSIDYLVVAGGGGGGTAVSGTNSGAGGGAGGMLTGTFTAATGNVYTATVGAGGGANSSNGSNSTITGAASVTSIGGGAAATGSGGNGSAGGSGGAAIGSGGTTSYTGGAGTSGQGFKGGDTGQFGGASGGGAGEAGFAGSTGTYRGGNGAASAITGSSVYYAGGGAMNTGTASLGGGGAGTAGSGNGTANTGGGGAGYNGGSGSGGSGVIILKVPTAQYTGTVTGSPSVTTSGSDTVIKFTSSGTYTA